MFQLEASDNRITDDLDAIVKCPNVRSLKICNNRIESFDAIKPLVGYQACVLQLNFYLLFLWNSTATPMLIIITDLNVYNKIFQYIHNIVNYTRSVLSL